MRASLVKSPPKRRRELPPLDLLRGFEAAARSLSFTQAATELFLTQSAISRQIRALEDDLGVTLFERRHRALALTDAGEALQRSVSAALAQLRETVRQITDTHQSMQTITVTTTVTFASLWLIPRLPAFRRLHPDIDVRISANDETVDLRRDRIDIAIRYAAPRTAPASATRLFGEEVVPVCSPALLSDRARPLRVPDDLRHHVLLAIDDAPINHPWLDWGAWLAAMSLDRLEPAGEITFNHYDQMIQAAIDGQGVALGRIPLLAELIRQGKLVSPFDRPRRPKDWRAPSRSFYAIVEENSAQRPEAKRFVEWLTAEAGRDRD
jgi:DNA-binding transcriptional LysR family regulator